jgi:proteasome assembly chaperone (PAC2) family protein
MLGFAKINNIKGIGLYGELNNPRIQQYRAAKSVLQILERLTYQRFGNLEELDVMAEAVDKEIEKMKKNGEYLEK